MDGRFKTSDAIFVSFQIGYATYTFETIVYRIADGGRGLDCLYPRILFYSEKRAARRAASDEALELEITLPPPFQRTIRGPITDISPGGVSFLTGDRDIALLIGTPLASIRIIHGGRIVRDVRGEIRNVLKVDDGNGGLLRYGVQFGIGRMAVQAAEMPAFEAAGREAAHARHREAAAGPAPPVRPEPSWPSGRPTSSAWRTRPGEEIVGLLNTSLAARRRPGPGRHHPARLRQDQGDAVRPGPDHRRELLRLAASPWPSSATTASAARARATRIPEASEPPYEMINASVSQGADDIGPSWTGSTSIPPSRPARSSW